MKHTPGPWRVSQFSGPPEHGFGTRSVVVDNGSDFAVAILPKRSSTGDGCYVELPAEANAAHIVRAVNLHADSLALARAVVDTWEGVTDQPEYVDLAKRIVEGSEKR
jgi:hypothetical protein